MRSGLFDALTALFLLGVSFSVVVSVASREDVAHLAPAIPLLAVHSGCLAWRRRAPLLVWGINIATGVAVVALGLPVVTLGVGVLVAIYTVAVFNHRFRSLVALATTTVAMVAALITSQPGADGSTLVGNVIVFGVVWFLGDSQRVRRVYVSQLEQRRAQLEAARTELARAAVAEERLRIARELHDVVAHSMGMIAVQAGIGGHVIESRPDEAKRSLETIAQASKSALAEIRGMLGLLRSQDDQVETSPSPGLEALPRLAEEVTQTGLEVELRVDEPPESLPRGLQLTIFRIVQEALTNTVKHATATRASVSVRFSRDVTRIDVVDDGVSDSTTSSDGHGISGMRERATMLGGRLETARLPEGGFQVSAEIPIGENS